MKKLLQISLLLSVVFASLFSQQRRNDALTVGMDLDLCPEANFVFKSNGGYDGYDIRVASMIARVLRRPLKIRNIQFSELTRNLKDGNVDLIISQMHRTTDKSNQMEQVPYTFQGRNLDFFNLLLNKNDNLNGNKSDFLAQLNSEASTIGVIRGTAHEDYLNFRIDNGLSNLNKRVFKNYREAAKALSNNRIRAVLFGSFNSSWVSNNENFKNVKSLQTSIVQGFQQVDGMAIGVRKDNYQLIDQVSNIIRVASSRAVIPVKTKTSRGLGNLKGLSNQFVPGSVLTNDLPSYVPQNRSYKWSKVDLFSRNPLGSLTVALINRAPYCVKSEVVIKEESNLNNASLNSNISSSESHDSSDFGSESVDYNEASYDEGDYDDYESYDDKEDEYQRFRDHSGDSIDSESYDEQFSDDEFEEFSDDESEDNQSSDDESEDQIDRGNFSDDESEDQESSDDESEDDQSSDDESEDQESSDDESEDASQE